MEYQLRDGFEIFLVSSSHCGYEVFARAHRFLSNIRYIYIASTEVDPHGNWLRYHRQIRGVFNDDISLVLALKKDVDQLKEAGLFMQGDERKNSSSTTDAQVSGNHSIFMLFLSLRLFRH